MTNLISDVIFFVAGGVVVVAVPAAYKWVARQWGGGKKKVNEIKSNL